MSKDRDGRHSHFEGADQSTLARLLRESCLLGDPSPEMVALTRHAMIGQGADAQMLRAILPIPKVRPESKWKVASRLRRERSRLKALGFDWGARCETIACQSSQTIVDYTTGAVHPMTTKPLHLCQAGLQIDDRLRVVPLPIYTDPTGGGPERRSHAGWDQLWLAKTPLDPSDNPFRSVEQPVADQSSLLSVRDVTRVFNAISFAIQQYGVTMNMHAIVVWSLMGLDALEGDKILKLYLNESLKWARVGSGPRWRLRNNGRAGNELAYVWVHENPEPRGFHSHILMNMPRHQRKEFYAWSRRCLARLSGKNVPWRAFRLVPSYAKDPSAEVQTGWRWFRYLTKQLDADAQLIKRDPVSGVSIRCARDALHVRRQRSHVSLPKMKMTGVSQNVGIGKQKAAGFCSMLDRGKLDELYRGEELSDYLVRVAIKGLPQPALGGWVSKFEIRPGRT